MPALEVVEPGDPTARMRATWVHLFDDTLKSRASIGRVIDELEAAGVNTVIAQVARRHDAYYNSDVLPRTADPDLEPGLDVLAELVYQAHARGIEVHAWISVAPTWHAVYEEFDPPAGWLASMHGRDAPEDQRWVTRAVDGTWSQYLDPSLPSVRDHVGAIVTELATRYPVDGIHLDYVRYESERHGYHPDALERFRSETGASGTPAPEDPAWSDWRRAQTRGLISHARQAIEASDPDVVLSAPVVVWGAGPAGATTADFAGTRPSWQALQDWPSWVRDGLVDVLMPMSYFRAHDDEQARSFDQWLAFQAHLAAEFDVRIVPGVAGWLNRPDATLAQVEAVMSGTDGVAIYSYQQPTDDGSRELWSDLAASAWMDEATGPR